MAFSTYCPKEGVLGNSLEAGMTLLKDCAIPAGQNDKHAIGGLLSGAMDLCFQISAITLLNALSNVHRRVRINGGHFYICLIA